ncbi:MAG: Fe-S cluster assembly protein NifU [Spirochaetota bacterium]
MWDYSDKVKELYKNPKNVGVIEDADAVGEEGSLVCGDALKVFLKIKDNVITDAKFQTFGCGSAIASSSALTEMIKGKTLEEAQKITNKDIVDYLGGLPEEKMHCSVMGSEALEKAIASYKGIKMPDKLEQEGEIICKCFGVTDQLIRKAIHENNLKTVEDVTNYTKAGGGCGSCIPDIERILEEELHISVKSETPEKKAPLSNIKRMQLVEKTISDVIRPQLQQDGGDIELVDVDNKKVYVSLRGHCSGCVASSVTLKHLVQEKLREFVESDIEVIEQK